MTDALKWLDIGLKALPALAALVFLAISHSFVTREEYFATSEKTDARVQKIEFALVQLVEQNKANDRQDQTMADHEVRIRALEAHHN